MKKLFPLAIAILIITAIVSGSVANSSPFSTGFATIKKPFDDIWKSVVEFFTTKFFPETKQTPTTGGQTTSTISYLPDLSITNWSYSNNGRTISVEITNLGNADATRRFEANATYSQSGVIKAKCSSPFTYLVAGKPTGFTCSFGNNQLPAGSYSVKASVDYRYNVTESNENNNERVLFGALQIT